MQLGHIAQAMIVLRRHYIRVCLLSAAPKVMPMGRECM